MEAEQGRNAASTQRHTGVCMHTPQLEKMQASWLTSQADQLCPVRKPAASEPTRGLTVLFWGQSNR